MGTFRNSLKFLSVSFIVLYSCQSFDMGKPGSAITRFSLRDQEQNTGMLIIPFDNTWQIYPEGTETGSPYEARVAELRSQFKNSAQLLFFSATQKENFLSKRSTSSIIVPMSVWRPTLIS